MHTPGPWIICDKQEEPRTVKIGTGENGWLGVAQSFGDTQAEATANAKLIAAAPDLLAAAKDALTWIKRDIKHMDPYNFGVINLELAIAKAEGK